MSISRCPCLVALILIASALPACTSEPAGDVTPSFTIGPIPTGEYSGFAQYFEKHTSVFGVHIFASSATPDDKVLHAAHVLAQYLDNDEDGSVDDADLVAEMVDGDGGASLVMFNDPDELESSGLFESTLLDVFRLQDLFGEETHLQGSSSEDGFDATLEEVWHLVSSKGHSQLRPDVFGEQQGSALAAAMDLARGGQFQSIPPSYPEGAWYHYDDSTCDYECQVAEYFYWALTANLGAQDYLGRCEAIANEWELCTPEQLQSGDPAVFALLTDERYVLPSVLPDGGYRMEPSR